MPKPSCAILLACWSLWIMPALCMGGVLSHACPQEAAGCGQSDEAHIHADHHADDDHHADHGAPDDCHHESDCSSDPCVSAITTAGRAVEDSFELLSVHTVVLQQFEVSCILLDPFGSAARMAHETSPCQRALHDSDLPLLI